MVLILVNEVLYRKERSIFFKTYDTVKDLYGIHANETGLFLEPIYLHIFKNENGKFILVDQLEQYQAIDLKGEKHQLRAEETSEWQSIIIKNSTCNCVRTQAATTCPYCGGEGELPNNFGRKLLSSFF